MAVFSWDWKADAPAECTGGWTTIGNFDGVHRGHAALLARLRHRAQAQGTRAVAVTLHPHPLLLLRPDAYLPTLTTAAHRAQLLSRAGADHVVVLNTTLELLRLTAEEFFARVLLDRLKVRGLVEGPNFGFGRNREGNVQLLARLSGSAGVHLELVSPVRWGEGYVSSSRTRKALAAGDVQMARELLGRPYRLSGVVAAGQKRGAGLGFPTANLEQVETLVPADGVYAGGVWLDGRAYAAAVNVGPNPTFGESRRKVETHLLGFLGDLIGRTLGIHFFARLRDVRRFDSVDDLRRQIAADVEQAAAIFSAAPMVDDDS